MKALPAAASAVAVSIALSFAATAADPPEWALEGRALPKPEFPQPSLDRNLPRYAPCEVEGRLEGTAPQILPQLVKRWIDAFGKREPRVKVEVPPPYLAPQSNGNPRLAMFLDGRIDFAFLTRDMSASDLARFRKVHGFDPLQIPVSGGSFRHFGFVDSVVVIVNEANPVKGLTLVELDAIFSKTRHRGGGREVRTWGDVGVTQWSDKPMRIVGTGAWAGEESARATFIRKQVMEPAGKRGEWRDGLTRDAGDAIVGDAVAADPLAIGFTGMGHLAKGVRAIAIAAERGGSYLEPDYENIASAAYPLSRVFYIVVARKPGEPLAAPLDAFVRFLLSADGQRLVLEQGIFLPLRAFQVADALALLPARDCAMKPTKDTRP